MAVRKRDKVRVETQNKYKNNMVIACIEIGSIVLVDWKHDRNKTTTSIKNMMRSGREGKKTCV